MIQAHIKSKFKFLLVIKYISPNSLHKSYERGHFMAVIATDICSKERDIRNNRACQLAYAGNFDDAINIFRELIAEDPQDIRALSNLATTLGKSGSYNESLDLFDQLVSRAPGMLPTRICYINLLTYFGHYEQACTCYRKMPRPGAVEAMLLGSLSEDFKKIVQISNGREPKDKKQEKFEEIRTRALKRISSGETPRFISLIRAGNVS